MKATETLAYYVGHAVLCALLLALLVPFGEWPLRVPFEYSGDGLFFSVLVKAVAEDGPFHFHRIGAPFGVDIIDWPLGMWFPFTVTSALVAVFGHAGTAINVYWLLSVVVAGLTATWAFIRLSVPRPIAFVSGLLYAFLPYTFYRNIAHVNVVYPVVPLLALLCLRVASARPEGLDRRERRVLLGACVVQGLSYVYYAFFACVLLAAAAVIGSIKSRRLEPARLGALGVLLLTLSTAVPLVPSFVYWSRHGRNELLEYKVPADADRFALKVRHLLTPNPGHPIGAFRAMADRVVMASFPDENENTHARLGLVGSVGFLTLLAMAVGYTSGALKRPVEELSAASALSLVALLLAQVGGFGSVFNVFVTPDIRAYNRIVVFIAFFSLYASAVLMSRGAAWARPHWRTRPLVRSAALALVLGLGVMDQVPLVYLAWVRSTLAPQFAEDESFVAHLERSLPPGAMVFQLPPATIPVEIRTRRTRMMAYDPGRAYLSSRSLRWSWGSVAGRNGDWQTIVAGTQPRAMTRLLALAGFSGIWIDRLGYPGPDERGWDRLEAALAEAASSTVEVSSRRRYSFLSIDGYRHRLEAELGPVGYAAARANALEQVFLVRWRAGCSDQRRDGPVTWYQCGPRAWAVVRNPLTKEVRVTLSGQFRSDRPGRLTIEGQDFGDALAIGDRPTAYRREVTIAADRKLRIDLSFDGPCSSTPEGPGCVQVIDLQASGHR